jgi:hypothetical protein
MVLDVLKGEFLTLSEKRGNFQTKILSHEAKSPMITE